MTTPVIAFGDDGSSHADRAWLWLNNQRWEGWSVDVITAAPSRSDLWSDELPVELVEWTPDAPRQAFAESGLVAVRHLRSSADPRIVLESCTQASLVVVGPKGRHGLRNLFLGSTADHLLRYPPAPLVIATTPRPVLRALVCTDGSPSARHAVETFAQLPLADQADHVAVLGVATVGVGVDHDDRAEVYAGVDQAVELLAAHQPEAIREQGDGRIAATVLDHAYAMRAQLIVVGTRGVTGLRRVLLGSTANAIARTAPCSVLVVPDRPDDPTLT
jgi:nucleotide-binding universal stress UspA family protein